MSEVTGHEQQEEDPPVVMFTNEAGEQTLLDPMQGVLFYLRINKDNALFWNVKKDGETDCLHPTISERYRKFC